jgi:hypothetical protein
VLASQALAVLLLGQSWIGCCQLPQPAAACVAAPRNAPVLPPSAGMCRHPALRTLCCTLAAAAAAVVAAAAVAAVAAGAARALRSDSLVPGRLQHDWVHGS